MKIKKQAAPVLILLLLLNSCSSAPQRRVDELAEQEQYLEAADNLEEHKRKLYRNIDKPLYYLDKGMLTHYGGLTGESIELLQTGERAIEEAFATSITQEIGTFLVNDNVREYDGEDYEDIYINTFNALNYYRQGDMEGALVEIRRMNNKIRYLSTKYGTAVSNLQRYALENGTEIPPSDIGNMQFSDSALARYLGLLFYRGERLFDDARIDREGLKLAFANSPSVYNYPVPASVDGELEIPQGHARLNVIAFTGFSPVKEAVTLRIPIGLTNYVKISLPRMVSRPSRIREVEIVLDDGRRERLELLEDIEAVARETFKAKENMIYLKTIVRAIVKSLASYAWDAAADETEDGAVSLVFSILGLTNRIYAEASEQADLRVSRYFPGKAWICGVNLLPGTYSFTVNYLDPSGGIVARSRYEDVIVLRNQLNLTEAICLQ
ncbi:MAG: hypothetical protein LBK83_02740 [Treponema sp.]|nr:hypothetical protein [Treponema sp.]